MRRRKGNGELPLPTHAQDKVGQPMWGGDDRLCALSMWWVRSPMETGRVVGVSGTGYRGARLNSSWAAGQWAVPLQNFSNI
jgi:hypothetical protein